MSTNSCQQNKRSIAKKKLISIHTFDDQLVTNKDITTTTTTIKKSRDSFDRFGDDLCQLILSFVSLDDCFRYECVSKQFQSFIFKTQTELVFNETSNLLMSKIYNIGTTNCYTITNILKKCPNIASIYLLSLNSCVKSPVNELFVSIGEHCHHLRHLTVNIDSNIFENISKQVMDEFFAKFNQRLTSCKLVFGSYSATQRVNRSIDNNIKQLSNLQKLDIQCLTYLYSSGIFQICLNSNEVMYSKLTHLKLTYCSQHKNLLDQFARHYGPKLKSLSILIAKDCNIDKQSIDLLTTALSDMTSLNKFDIDYSNLSNIDFTSNILSQLTTIAVNCKDLKLLSIKFICNMSLFNKIFVIINDHMRQLTYLSITMLYSFGYKSRELCPYRFSKLKQLTKIVVNGQVIRGK